MTLERDAMRTARRMTRLYIRFLWKRHKRHYQSAFTFWGKMRPAIYDDQCLFCQAFKPVEDEFVAEIHENAEGGMKLRPVTHTVCGSVGM